jgi:uncharacterized protein (TIRG00374 family)
MDMISIKDEQGISSFPKENSIKENNSNIKGKLVIAGKFIFTGALFAWLLSNNKIDLSTIHPSTISAVVVSATILYWLIGPVYLASLRWKLLLEAAGYKISLARSVTLQLIGFFFTTVLPGSLGGDFVKVFYLIKENPHKEKSLAFWAILFDRLIGMLGLFLTGAIFIAFNFDALWKIDALKPLIILTYGYIFSFLAFIVLINALEIKKPGQDISIKTFHKIVDFITACKVYRGKNKVIVVSSILSTLSHALSFVAFLCVANSLSAQNFNWVGLSAIFPIGMLITTLPLSPGGFGVGHFAFEQLFNLIDMQGGANTYNIYFLSQTLLNLTGVIAYLLNKPKSNL